MTITEQLQFSVLTAPVATLDRRALSQAWYSALYGARANARAAHAVRGAADKGGARTLCAAGARGTSCAALVETQRAARVHAPVRKNLPSHASAIDRRASRSPLARKIERVLLRPRADTHKTAFTIESEHGRVRVLLQSHGTQLKLIAICAPRARAQVAAALAQARYALALRGIDLDADARGSASC
jgi:hypothetical protein